MACVHATLYIFMCWGPLSVNATGSEAKGQQSWFWGISKVISWLQWYMNPGPESGEWSTLHSLSNLEGKREVIISILP